MENINTNPEDGGGDRLALAAQILTALREIADALDIDLDLSRPQRLLVERVLERRVAERPPSLDVQPDSPEAETGVEILAHLLDADRPLSARDVADAHGFSAPVTAMGWMYWLADLGLVRHNARDLTWEPCPAVRMEWDCAGLLGVVA